MSPWASGDSLTPSTLNLRQASASSVGGFSSNTLKAESGVTISLLTTAFNIRTTFGATGMDMRTGDGSAAGILFAPDSSAGTDVYGQVAVSPRGTGLAGSARAAFRVFSTDVTSDYTNYEAVCLETHNDADGKLRDRIVTRRGGTGEHRPFYFQVGGNNSLSIDTVAGAIVSSEATAGGFSWVTKGSIRGDIVLGVNGTQLRQVNSGNTGSYHMIGGDNSNQVRIDSDNRSVVIGDDPSQDALFSLRVGHSSQFSGSLVVSGRSGGQGSRDLRFAGLSPRVNLWVLRTDTQVESAGNGGADMEFIARDNDGLTLDTPIKIQRGDGLGVIFQRASLHSDGAALRPGIGYQSEVSLGFYRSAASINAQSYGWLSAPRFISSSTTDQSASSAKIVNQGEIVFSILSLTANGAAMYYRSGNSVFGWASNLAVG